MENKDSLISALNVEYNGNFSLKIDDFYKINGYLLFNNDVKINVLIPDEILLDLTDKSLNELISMIDGYIRFSIPILEDGKPTEYTVDGVIGDDKYFDILKYGDGKNLPSVINIGLKK